ncbi:hypothetical protein ACP70R_016099 [Stipagrostis hirtigluma subsp. patula]
MESGHKSGGGALPGGAGAEGAGGGLLCHACGYQYPNAHPSAKQRRAHRKNCGKTPPASPAVAAGAEVEEEEGAAARGGKGLFPGEGGGGGIGAGAAECGGGLPGSALEVGDAAVDRDSAEHSSRDGTDVRSGVDECAEVTPEANKTDSDVTLPEVATQYSEKGLPLLDENPSDPVVSSEQLQDVSATSLVQPEPEDAGSRFGSAFSVYEREDSSVMSQASHATGDETYEQRNDVVSQLTDTDFTEVDGMDNTIAKQIPSEDKSVLGGEFDFSCQESLQTKIFEGHSTTAVEEDPSEKNLNAAHNYEIPISKTEYNQQSKLDSVEQVPNTEEPVESCTEKSVGSDDYSCVDLTKLGTGSCHSGAPEYVKPQQQPDTTSVTAYHLAVPNQVDNDEGQDYPNTDGGIQAISSASEPAVDDESVGRADNSAKNACSSDVTMGGIIQENVNTGTCQVDLVELSTNDVDDKMQNEKIGADFATPEMNEVHIVENLEEKLQNKEITAESTSLDNSCKISAVQITSSIEEKEQIDEVIADLASEKINNVTSSRDMVEETEQSEVNIETNHGVDVACSTDTIEGKNATCQINAGNATDNDEDKKQSEEITTSLICTTANEKNMYSKEITEHPSSHETVVVDSTDNVEETKSEDTMADPASHRIGVVAASGSVEDRQEEEKTQNTASCQINVAPTTNNVEEKKNEEPILDPTTCKISMISSTDDVEEKQQNEGATADPSSGENNTTQSTGDSRKGMKNGDTTTDPAPDETKEGTDNVGERGQEESAAKEISTVKSSDDLKATDQSEEIADKEMVTDSERNHVSLKVLLADKSMETKEKKASAKDRVLSFKRRSSKDNVSPVKPGSPKAGSGQQDWNSPARLPTEKKPKGRKQQWVPFICCPSIH